MVELHLRQRVQCILFSSEEKSIKKVAEDTCDCVLRFGYEQSTGLFA